MGGACCFPTSVCQARSRQRRWPAGPGFTDRWRGADNRTCDRTIRPQRRLAPRPPGGQDVAQLARIVKTATLILIDATTVRIAAQRTVAVFQFPGFCLEFWPVFGRAVPDRRLVVAIHGCRYREGRHGTDPNVAVCIGAVPYTVPEHECGGIIAPGRDCVHGICLRPRSRAGMVTTMPTECRHDCSCVRVAGSRF